MCEEKTTTEEVTLKYMDVDNHMQCSNKQITVSKRALETIIEMAMDYSKIIENQIENQETAYKRAVYQFKSKEVQKIADDLIEKIGYCKNCSKKARELDDVGMDAFSIMGRRNREKKED